MFKALSARSIASRLFLSAAFWSILILALAFPDSPNLPIHASPSLAVLAFAFAVVGHCAPVDDREDERDAD